MRSEGELDGREVTIEVPPSSPRVVAPFGDASGAGLQEVVFRVDKLLGGGRGREKRKMKVGRWRVVQGGAGWRVEAGVP